MNDLPPSELDILIYIASEADHFNEFEKKFLPSVISWLSPDNATQGYQRYLSEKQMACVVRMCVRFKINPKTDVVAGYADEQTIATALRILNPPKPTAAPSYPKAFRAPASFFDDMDDDIPF